MFDKHFTGCIMKVSIKGKGVKNMKKYIIKHITINGLDGDILITYSEGNGYLTRFDCYAKRYSSKGMCQKVINDYYTKYRSFQKISENTYLESGIHINMAFIIEVNE